MRRLLNPIRYTLHMSRLYDFEPFDSRTTPARITYLSTSKKRKKK